MAKSKSKGLKHHAFRDKLTLNQWIISLFGIDPLAEHKVKGKSVRPFHLLADPIRDPQLEGMDQDNLHHFFHCLAHGSLFSGAGIDSLQISITKDLLLYYEQNIVRHTQAINEKRTRPITWKYYQWLTLLFTEIYLDRFFRNRKGLLMELNAYLDRFNRRWSDYVDIPSYTEDDLNKLCFQNATGSGKTLLMHVNFLQYQFFASKHGKINDLSRVILLTPNESLSEQHIAELHQSGFDFVKRLQPSNSGNLNGIDVIEITKLGDQEGPNTFATRSLGDQNLLLVDEGHRGMSGKEEGVWFRRRSDLCTRGFTFEYSATFEQAVKASGNSDFENAYAKTVLFDYSYRWFYEDGFGKDYQILNLPDAHQETQSMYMTACLLKFYQQLRIFKDRSIDFKPFFLEKPLWVFVGNTVSGKMSKEEKKVATDVALIVQFIAEFLEKQQVVTQRIHQLLSGRGQDTGLLDKDGNDIFAGAFNYLLRCIQGGETAENIYRDILSSLFNHSAGGRLTLERIKGDSGEIVLRVGTSETPFGLINVGDAKGLCDHIASMALQNNTSLGIEDSDFSEPVFATVKESSSPIHLLIGSKKFVEGWDCWRVSTMGLMHVGRSEGTQIIQLFGRGIRLKGHQWSLKRSTHIQSTRQPPYIEELETLNVFGIEADFMEKFRDFLKDEGLPGNERREIVTIPLNVTYDFGKRLKILRPKRKNTDGKEYDFKKDASVPSIGEIPEYLQKNPVVTDWYPRIQSLQSRGAFRETQKDKVSLGAMQLSLLDYDKLFFELEQFKRERKWYNLNVTKSGIIDLLENSNWYTLYLPEARLNPANFEGVLLLQEVALELLKRYTDHFYSYRKRKFIEPRMELRELKPDDDNIPQEPFYQLITDGNEEQVVQGIQEIKKELEEKKKELLKNGDLQACDFKKHLFQPLFHVRKGGKIVVLPVVLNESEFTFVNDLREWCNSNQSMLEEKGMELFLLRNLSRGKGVGFFEAGNFHPDFILWLLQGKKQHITFIEPHGLLHEGPASSKVLFHQRIKEIEHRLQDSDVVLNSFILSVSRFHNLFWDLSKEDLESMNILFMEDQETYINTMVEKIG